MVFLAPWVRQDAGLSVPKLVAKPLDSSGGIFEARDIGSASKGHAADEALIFRCVQRVSGELSVVAP